MLIQFSVSNYMSFKEEAVFSMAANENDEQHHEMLYHTGRDSLLPVGAVYGANAAGKSNLFQALAAAVLTIRESMARQVDESLKYMVPFRFCQDTLHQPTYFDFIFTMDGNKYQYGFSATSERVVDEYLYVYRTARPSMVFERSDTDNYHFTKKNEKELRNYVSKNTQNKLFLSTATAWNCQLTRAAYMWFASRIDVYSALGVQQAGQKLIAEGEDSLRAFLLRTLQNADLNIADYSLDKQKRIITEEDLSKVPPFVVNLLMAIGDNQSHVLQYDIMAGHDVKDENGDIHRYMLPFRDESNGTQRMFFFAALIKEALDHGKTILVDEIDTGLHPLLVQYLLQMFLNRDINAHGAQLIFTTHDVSMLSLSIFRRDQIYFVEKDNASGQSVVYSLDEFSPRKTENIRNGYLQGRYGAIPVIDRTGVIW